MKEDKAFRVVIKGLHASVTEEDIKSEIEEGGYQVRKVSNIRHWKTKNPLPMFFFDLEPAPNNKEIYNVKALLHMIVKIEPPKIKRDIVQCKRCQSYGHSQNYCTRPFRCVKCGANHPSNDCKKNKEEPAKCALCDSAHTSNYRGCTVVS